MRMVIPTTQRWAWPVRHVASDVDSEVVSDIFEDFDRVVDSFLRPTTFNRIGLQPTLNLNEAEDHYLATFDMPGVKKSDIKIELRGHQLAVSGERRNDLAQSNARNFGRFERVFTLPESVDTGKIEAHHEDGVLTIVLPKSEASKPKTIEIQSGETGFLSRLLGAKKETPKELKDVKLS